MRSYKVLEVKQKALTRTHRLNGRKMQAILNREAQAGWTFDKAVSGETLFLDRSTCMLIFYQEAEPAPSSRGC